jgi:hypothetical protein
MSCVFSVELSSKKKVRSISISDEAHDRVLFEGDLGKLLELSMINSSAMEVRGEHGVLRMEISEDLLLKVLSSPGRELSLCSGVEQKK